ncbi:MAG: GNAT family N-acetyltransferase [Gammaproteobacteria bacterium]
MKYDFSYSLVDLEDIPQIESLIKLSIDKLQAEYLVKQQIEASHQAMGLDLELITDKTYIKITNSENKIVGCGGWGKRKTLFGGSHTKDRDGSFLDSSRDAAKIRAMYTHPNWIRKGIGSLVLDLSENFAREEGFKKFELMATLSGEPLYIHHGYKVVEEVSWESSSGIIVPLKKMIKEDGI